MASKVLTGQPVTLLFWPDETFTCAGCHKPIRGDVFVPESICPSKDSMDPPTAALRAATWHGGCARSAGADLSAYESEGTGDEDEDDERENNCE
jgi:hypothetical protein